MNLQKATVYLLKHYEYVNNLLTYQPQASNLAWELQHAGCQLTVRTYSQPVDNFL